MSLKKIIPLSFLVLLLGMVAVVYVSTKIDYYRSFPTYYNIIDAISGTSVDGFISYYSPSSELTISGVVVRKKEEEIVLSVPTSSSYRLIAARFDDNQKEISVSTDYVNAEQEVWEVSNLKETLEKIDVNDQVIVTYYDVPASLYAEILSSRTALMLPYVIEPTIRIRLPK